VLYSDSPDELPFALFSSLDNRVWVSPLNRAVVVLRAMFIGKCKDMYAEIFSFYFRNAMMRGLDAPFKDQTNPPLRHEAPTAASLPSLGTIATPIDDAPTRMAGRSRAGQARTPFVVVVLDFETDEHDGALQAMAKIFGGSPADFYGRAIGGLFIGFFRKNAALISASRFCSRSLRCGTPRQRGGWRRSSPG